jgi:hypothetical protein
MRIHVLKWLFVTFLFVVTSVAKADIPCAEDICLRMPDVLGDVVNGVYYNGEVEVSVDIQDYDQLGFNREVYFSTDGGGSWLPFKYHYDQEKYFDDSIKHGTDAHVSILNSGRILVAWREVIKDADATSVEEFRLYYKIYNSDGTSYANPVLVDTVDFKSGSLNLWPDIKTVALGGDQFVILWSKIIEQSSRRQSVIHAQIYNEAGNVIRNAYRVNSRKSIDDSCFYGYSFDVSKIDGSGFFLVYAGESDSYIRGTYVQKFDLDGNAVGQEYDLRIAEGSFQVNLVALKGVNAGGFAVSWNNREALRMKMYNSSFVGIGAEYTLLDSLKTIDGRDYHEFKAGKMLASADGGISFGYVGIRDLNSRELIRWDGDDKTVAVFFDRFNDQALLMNPTIRIWEEWTRHPLEDHLPLINLLTAHPIYQSESFSDSVGINLFQKGDSVIINWHTLMNEDYIPGNNIYRRPYFVNSFAEVLNGSTIGYQQDNYTRRTYVPPYDFDFHGLYYSDFFDLGDGAYLAKTFGEPIYDLRDRGNIILVSSNLHKISVIINPVRYWEHKFIHHVKPLRDLDIQFKVHDKDNPHNDYFSPVRHLIYADPNDGADGSIDYLNGYTNLDAANIAINMTCQTCDVLQISQRSAPLTQGACGAYGKWVPIGGTAPSNVVRSIPVNDAHCYQFKADVSNEKLGVSQEYTNPNILRVDQSNPTIHIQSTNLDFDMLNLGFVVTDSVSGISSQTYDLNAEKTATAFAGNVLNLKVDNGVNRVHITATDLAGNSHSINHFVTADLTPPQINVIGIDEGATYSGDLALVYSLTQALNDVVITVDGTPRNDLVGLADGAHTLVISGLHNGTPVSQTVNFTIDSNAFSFQLLSPQNNRDYQYNSIAVQYQSNKPLSSLTYTLDEGDPQSELKLRDLSNGIHNIKITAVSEDGENEVREIDFSVQQSIPLLSISSPVNGAVYPDLSVPLNIDSDGNLALQLDGVEITDRDYLVFTEDGAHTLIVTSTHPVSGSMVSEVITFTTDSVSPEVVLLNPEPRIYTEGDIQINYTSNKQLSNVQYLLNGNPVDSLSNLAAGRHLFRMTANDAAGRSINIPISFDVALLDFLKPTNNSQLFSDTIPPHVDVQYMAEGNYDNYTLAVDDNQPFPLTSDEGPGSTIPVSVSPGQHDLVLRGQMGALQLGRRVNFRVGAKNITVGPGSIDYHYSNCDAEFRNCDVTVELTAMNRGDYDINEDIPLRFDHIDSSHSESFWISIPSLKSKDKAKRTLLPFKASLGDIFTVNVDPNAELSDEFADDNIYSIEFSAGQITDVKFVLDPDNVYLEGVSVFNPVAVDIAGPIEKIEYRFNGWVFENSDKPSQFSTLIDMGLLDKDNLCVEIRAISDDGIILDAAQHCFLVSSLNIKGLTKYSYNWEYHQTTPKRVIYDNINAQQMLKQTALTRSQVLSTKASIFPNVKIGGKVDYKFQYDPGSIMNRLVEKNERWSRDGFMTGSVGLPNGQSLVMSTIDPTQGACNVDGAIPLPLPDRQVLMSDLLAETLDEIDKKSSKLLDNLRINEMTAYVFLTQIGEIPIFYPVETGGDLLYSSQSIYPFERLLGVFGGETLENMFSGFREKMPAMDLLAGFFDLKLVHVGWLHGHIPSRLVDVTPSGSWVNRFVGDHCILVDRANNDVEIRLEGYYEWGLEDVAFNISVNDLNIGIDAYSYLGLGLPLPPLPSLPTTSVHIPLLFTHGSFRLYGLDTNVPLDYGVRHGVKVVDNNLEEFGPFHARFGLSVNIDHQLAKADLQVYPAFLTALGLPSFFNGFGLGQDYKLFIKMIGDVKFDLIAGQGFDDQFFKYMDYEASVKLYKRKKICIFGRCHHRSWKLDKIIIDRPDLDENIPYGVFYSKQQVDDTLDSIGAPWRTTF